MRIFCRKQRDLPGTEQTLLCVSPDTLSTTPWTGMAHVGSGARRGLCARVECAPHKERGHHPLLHPMSFSPTARTASPAKEARLPRKRGRIVRSCLECRKSKQRCDLFTAALQSSASTSSHICRRCQVLGLTCAPGNGPDFASSPRPQIQKRPRKQHALEDTQTLGYSSTIPSTSPSSSKSRNRFEHDPEWSTNTSIQSPIESSGEARRSRHNGQDLMQLWGNVPSVDDDGDVTSGLRPDWSTTPDRSNVKEIHHEDANDVWLKLALVTCRPFQLLDHFLHLRDLDTGRKQETAGPRHGSSHTCKDLLLAHLDDRKRELLEFQ